MRAGLIIYGELTFWSGGYLYDRKLVEYLRSQGDEVKIISLPVRNYFMHVQDNFNPALRDKLANLRVDVLLQDELAHPSLFILNRYLKKTAKYPLVSIVHHLSWREKQPFLSAWGRRQIEQWYLDSVDAVICASQTTLQEVRQLGGDLKPSLVATPGGDALKAPAEGRYSVSGGPAGGDTLQALPQGHHRAPAGDELQASAQAQHSARGGDPLNLSPQAHHYPRGADKPLEFLFVGQWIPRKGLHVLLEALRSLTSYSWHLSLVGKTDVNPPYYRKVLHGIEALGLKDRVRVYGEVSDAELTRLLALADVLVVPSQYEGFGIVYLEAMGFGVIPIAGGNGGGREIIQPGVNGFLVHSDSPGDLRYLLKELLENPLVRETIKQGAKKRYKEFPTWRESMDSVRRFLLDILSRGSESPQRVV